MTTTANKPIELSEFISMFQISFFVNGKVAMICNFDTNSTGMFATRQAAEHQVIIEIMKNPNVKYFIHQLDFPVKDFIK
jgi:hypothetical protein